MSTDKQKPKKKKPGPKKRNPRSLFLHMDQKVVDSIFDAESNVEKAKKLVTAEDYKIFINNHPELKKLEDKYTIKEIEGDLFESKDSLAHCVSKDLAMSKGVAVGFVKNFGGVDELKSQKKSPGEVAFLQLKDRCIFYLITKENYFNIPSYENLWSSLCEMSQLCIKYQVKTLSMPVIACGLDRLNWTYVKDLIEKAFLKTGVQITIYVWK
eukprot:gene5602-9419_t